MLDLLDILLVEDNAGDADLVREALNFAEIPARIHRAATGQEALAFLRRGDAPRPRLILLDLNLPAMNGHDFLVRIKSDPDLERIPVIIVSSSDLVRDPFLSYENGAAGYLQKRAEFETFARALGVAVSFWSHRLRMAV